MPFLKKPKSWSEVRAEQAAKREAAGKPERKWKSFADIAAEQEAKRPPTEPATSPLPKSPPVRIPAAPTTWWSAPDAFATFGWRKSLRLKGDYLGGHNDHPKPYKDGYLEIDADGIKLSGFKRIITAPWASVRGIDVEGPDQVSKRVTATRVLAMGVFALAAKKRAQVAYLTVSTTRGELIFEAEGILAPELKGKLLPIIARIRRSAG